MATKILIAGLGGVGGFIGHYLAKHAEKDSSLEIYFLCRGQHLEKIKLQGLSLWDIDYEQTAMPTVAASDCLNMPKMDYILMACKSYDLENMSQQILPCVASHTTLIPLLNGINHHLYLESQFPESLICQAFIYIVSKLERPGLIIKESKTHSLYFGDGLKDEPRLLKLQQLLNDAGINAIYSQEINNEIWRKFTFISPIASLTSAYNLYKKDIFESELYMSILRQLMHEVVHLSKAMRIQLPENIVEKHLENFEKLPDNSSSSMHRDTLANKSTEIKVLCEFVIEEASKHKIVVPTYHKVFKDLQNNMI